VDAFIALAIAVILVAIIILVRTQQQRSQLSLPSGDVVYQDNPERPGQLLYSHTLKISGKPDVLIQKGNMVIPVELKTGRTPDTPFEGHILQLVAYCHLIEAEYQIRPTHGIIRYPNKEFTVEYSAQMEQELKRVVSEMRAKRRMGEIHRHHKSRAKCVVCGYREVCSERLDQEYQMPLDL
jgi:CRISPR-associated exonuclease Cas4